MKTHAKKYHYLPNPWFFVLEGVPIPPGGVLGVLEVIFSKYIPILRSPENFKFFLRQKIFFRAFEKIANAHFGKEVTQIVDPKQTGLHCKPAKYQIFVPVDTA